MKRIWFAVIFLALTAVLCVCEQCFIADFYKEMNESITTAESAIKQSDKEEYKKAADEMSALWKKKNDILYAVGEHAKLDDIALQINSLPYENGEELKELHSLRAQLYDYYENEKISFSNIL